MSILVASTRNAERKVIRARRSKRNNEELSGPMEAWRRASTE